jgi:hypothetical protein
MKPRTPKSLDVETVLRGWRGATPPSGFADRVLSALDTPARSPARTSRTSRRPWLLLGAVACAVLLIPFVILHGTRGADASPPVAFAESDLGIQRD